MEEIPVTHAVVGCGQVGPELAAQSPLPSFPPPKEERDDIKEQPADPTQTLPFPDALLQVGWVVQVRQSEGWGCWEPCPCPPASKEGALACASLASPNHSSCSMYALPPSSRILLCPHRLTLTPSPTHTNRQAARDPEVQVPPLKVPLLYGLACSIHMLLPAAYYVSLACKFPRGDKQGCCGMVACTSPLPLLPTLSDGQPSRYHAVWVEAF